MQIAFVANSVLRPGNSAETISSDVHVCVKYGEAIVENQVEKKMQQNVEHGVVQGLNMQQFIHVLGHVWRTGDESGF